MKGNVFLIIFVSLITVGCATAESGRTITPEEITWMQKGVTTRVEVVEKLGYPMSEVPDWSKMDLSSTSTTTTTTITGDDGQTPKSVSTTTVQTNPGNKFSKALYIHTKSTGGLFVGFETTQEQFCVVYDEQGVVQDYGFSGGMNMTVH